ncbi:MAG: hypothetical protein V1648_01975 [Candidatus Aenigmatarchaeota archaeon]
MGKKKGFMHIVEVMLVVILVFFAFSQFSSIPDTGGGWPKTKLSLLASDSLKMLDAKGVDWFNGTALAKALNGTIPENMIYSIKLQNVIKPVIKIGCLCSDNEFNRTRFMLSPGWTVINGVNISFELVQVKSLDEAFSLEYDVTLVNGYTDLGSAYAALRNFVSYDKGVVEIFDRIGQDDANVQANVFGIESGPKASDATGMIFSVSSSQNGRDTNKIYENYVHAPVFYDVFESLGQWAGTADLNQNTGKPVPSLRMGSGGCGGGSYAFTRFYDSFRNGEIDFDVFLRSGSALTIAFGKSSAGEYLATISGNSSLGYDSFYQREPMHPIGTNTSHSTSADAWHHIKIISSMGELTLYNDGVKVASAQSAGLTGSNITLSSNCANAMADNMRVTLVENSELANFLDSENITQKDGNQNKILLVQKGSGLPGAVINYNIESVGKGRTAWLSNMTTINEDYKNLVKALVMWAAGSEYSPVKANLKQPVTAFMYKSLGNDMQQNAKIILEIDYIY